MAGWLGVAVTRTFNSASWAPSYVTGGGVVILLGSDFFHF